MENNPIRDMIRDMEIVARDHPDEYPLMIGSTWNLLTDIVDASETEIDGLNTHSEEDYRMLIQQIHDAPENERQELFDMYTDWGPEPIDVEHELRWLRHLASMIDILHDLHGGQCDLQIKLMADAPDDLDDYDYVWQVIPDTEDYTAEPPLHLIRYNNPRTYTFHVHNDTIRTGKAKEES